MIPAGLIYIVLLFEIYVPTRNSESAQDYN